MKVINISIPEIPITFPIHWTVTLWLAWEKIQPAQWITAVVVIVLTLVWFSALVRVWEAVVELLDFERGLNELEEKTQEPK